MTKPTMTQVAICSSLENRWIELQESEVLSIKNAKKAQEKKDFLTVLQEQKNITTINAEIQQIEVLRNFYDKSVELDIFYR